MTEGFEGLFPSTGWSVFDDNPYDGKEYYWDDDDYRPYSGGWAAWPANGGADGIDPGVSPSRYPPNMNAWMIYGPFDLSNATFAEAAFMLWRAIEVGYDAVFFGASTDANYFSGYQWDGNVDWEYQIIDLASLGSFLGQSNVWLGWNFTSDGWVEYEGAWIDEVTLTKYEPGDVRIHGQFTYADRSGEMQGATGINVQLWDWDADGDDLLAQTAASEDGQFSFPPITNWDQDDTDPNPSNRRLDLYIRYALEHDDYLVTDFDWHPYSWRTSVHHDFDSGVSTWYAGLPWESVDFQAMWLFQDIRRTRAFYSTHTIPPSSPGALFVHWEKDANAHGLCSGSCFSALDPNLPYAFIAHSSIDSADTVVHELGHHIMWNSTGQWLWYDFACFAHQIFSQESTQCAWSEGWADFLALAVNGDPCYDFDIGPCTGTANARHFDLENHTRNDDPQQFAWGDGVEGRVAGTLYDLMDELNEPPWYDDAVWGFAPIVDLALPPAGRENLQAFWNGYQATDAHFAVRSFHQNTINYNQPPTVDNEVPIQYALQDTPRSHLLDLWDYTSDAESPDLYLTYEIAYSDPECGISLDAHWVNAHPQAGWTGWCFTWIHVSDSLAVSQDPLGFWLRVLPVHGRIHLPIARDE